MIEKLIHAVTQQLTKHKIEYMVIGGQAVLIYGRPRLTRDIDITLAIDTDHFDRVDQLCHHLKLIPLAKDAKEFAIQTRVFPVEDPKSHIRIDFIFSFTPYESAAIQRAKQIQIGKHAVKFASCEDVIIHKMIAGRAIDDEDVKSIVQKNSAIIDRAYIENWLTEFALLEEYEHVLSKWKQLLKESL
jgi:predicted nucleotidyltransferase